MKRRAVIFPDTEPIMVAAIREVLLQAGETGIRVATRKATAQEEELFPARKQIIVRSDGGVIFQRVAKEEDFGINIFVKDEDRNAGYAEANRLASLLEALIPLTPGVATRQLVTAELNSIISIETDSEEQQRYARVTVILHGSTLTL
jgi:hypothetical protein